MSLLWHRLPGVESPVVERTFYKRSSVKKTRRLLLWALINFLLALVFYIEISYGSMIEFLFSAHPIVWHCECGLMVLFLVCGSWDVVSYVCHVLSVSATPVELSDEQKVLLGVRRSDLGFRSPLPTSPSPTHPSPHPIFSPSHLPSPLNMQCSPASPYSQPTYNPSFTSGHSPTHHTPSPLGGVVDRSGGPTSGSPGHLGGSFLDQSVVHAHSASLSASFCSGAATPNTPNLSLLFHEDSLGTTPTSGLRSRFTGSPFTGSPLVNRGSPREDCITDLKALDAMMAEEREREALAQISAAETSPGGAGGPSFWRFNRTLSDYTPILRKYQYQIACRSPQSSKSTAKDDDTDQSTTYTHDQVWLKAGVSAEVAERWVENLRKWIRETVLVRLVQTIDQANTQLSRAGSDDMLIGEVSISILKQLALTKSQQVPALNDLIPFLEVTPNQEYLVTRIREIARGGCMSDFNWNGGANFKGKPWGEHLPTDCVIVMHLLCTYLDCRLPPNPKYPDGKTFTSQHFLKTPDKPNLTRKDNLCLYQSTINPPHYKVILQDDLWNPSKGRNNMFYAILLFLNHIKKVEHGMIGRVNLGMSGINILWVNDN